ncbi:MAG TPA: pyridoxal-phosphate dependent enzyme [Solirubrobacterales bacterium]|nr:pyridoxal-phosphate dependent enzyme [Solirubrobacterales bacterium]
MPTDAETVAAELGPDRIEDAARVLAGHVRTTPVLRAGALSRRLGVGVTLKCENVQRAGSFKIRGAQHRIARLTEDQLRRGVVAASAGNHAQAVSVAARERGIAARLFMPAGAPLAKVEAVRGYGGEVELVHGSYEEAAAAAREHAERTGATLIHPYDDLDVIAGQGTVGLEIAQQAPRTGLIVVPVGGGGLAAGVAIAARSRFADCRVVGVQAEGRVRGTICDGIAVKRPGEVTGPLLAAHVDELVTVADDEVAEAIVLLLERSKLVAEGAGAAAVAALLSGKVAPPRDGEICAVLSGGNVDATRLAECIRLGETAAGRRLVFTTVVPDRPGALASLLATIAELGSNVIDVAHIREGFDLHVRETAVRLVLQTDGPEHGDRVLAEVRERGFEAQPEDMRSRSPEGEAEPGRR